LVVLELLCRENIFKKDFLFICRFLVVAFSEMNEALEEFDPPSNLCGVDRKEHVAPKV